MLYNLLFLFYSIYPLLSNLMLSSFQTSFEMHHPSCSRDVKDVYLLQEQSILKNIHTGEVISLASNPVYVSYEEPTNLFNTLNFQIIEFIRYHFWHSLEILLTFKEKNSKF